MAPNPSPFSATGQNHQLVFYFHPLILSQKALKKCNYLRVSTVDIHIKQKELVCLWQKKIWRIYLNCRNWIIKCLEDKIVSELNNLLMYIEIYICSRESFNQLFFYQKCSNQKKRMCISKNVYISMNKRISNQKLISQKLQ